LDHHAGYSLIQHLNGLSLPDRAGAKQHVIAARAGHAALALALAAFLAVPAQAAATKHKKNRNADAAKHGATEKPPAGPLTIIVSIASQRVTLYANGQFVARGPVSTGVRGHPTPVGVFTVIQKDRYHHSNIYSGAPMPYMQRITWSGVAIHQGVLPGHPASHGCIRTSNEFAIKLWGITNLGTRVIVSRSDVAPAAISNANLFALASEPTPIVQPEPVVVRALAPPAVVVPAVERPSADPANANNPVEVKGTDEAAPTAVDPAGPTPIDAAKAAADSAMLAEAARQPGTVSVFVSKKAGRLYVRHANQPLFDVPVQIREPERPLGTHVFTALAVDKDWKNMRWSVVTMPSGPAPRAEVHRGGRKSRHNNQVQVPEPVPSVTSAADALGRIEMPREVVERVAEMLTPGASLIISDNAMSGETTKNTDFIILTH
jgi:L,D-transpeptidase catalytic domain